ncbi:hypothetical protein, partial [Pseudomonas aeruginosa]|uniref:hypothetical protein n=1 Tax=Pseudomonas aeruginosa TaxID=287 RepID=UPI0034517DD1
DQAKDAVQPQYHQTPPQAVEDGAPNKRIERQTQSAHRAPLDMRQRRLLILCDGQRTVADLTGLLGQEAPAMVIQLVQAG